MLYQVRPQLPEGIVKWTRRGDLEAKMVRQIIQLLRENIKYLA